MSLFKKISDKLASESAHLKKIRLESEQRRAGKSSGSEPEDADKVISKTLSSLSARIRSGPVK